MARRCDTLHRSLAAPKPPPRPSPRRWEGAEGNGGSAFSPGRKRDEIGGATFPRGELLASHFARHRPAFPGQFALPQARSLTPSSESSPPPWGEVGSRSETGEGGSEGLASHSKRRRSALPGRFPRLPQASSPEPHAFPARLNLARSPPHAQGNHHHQTPHRPNTAVPAAPPIFPQFRPCHPADDAVARSGNRPLLSTNRQIEQTPRLPSASRRPIRRTRENRVECHSVNARGHFQSPF